MDPTLVKIVEFIGYAGAAFAGGAVGGKKAFKVLRDDVAWLKSKVVLIMERLGMDTEHKPGNGKAELGLADQSHRPDAVKLSERARSGG